MKSLMHIGNTYTKKSRKQIDKSIKSIFKSANKYHTSENVVIMALDTLTKVAKVKNINVQNSTFTCKDNND